MPTTSSIKLLGRPHCGLISAVDADGKYFHVKEETLEPAYEARFQDVAGFSDEVAESKTPLAAVQLDHEGFHIRPDGTPAYPERYEIVMDFEGGRAQVAKKSGQRCFITFFDDGKVHEFGEW